MAKKIYAVRKGYDFDKNVEIKNKIVYTWNECLELVKGVKGAEYKSFKELDDAEEYLKGSDPLLKKGVDEYPTDVLHAYVDGSYNERKNIYSYAVVLVKNDVVIYIENDFNQAESSIRQIAGELKGTIRAAEYAADNKINKMVIFHDYVGCCYHALGYWERRDKSSREYYNNINNLIISNGLDITFVKVDSHTGDLFNEVADEMAKVAASVEVKGVVNKYVKNKTIMVNNSSIKEKLSSIVDDDLLQNIIII